MVSYRAIESRLKKLEAKTKIAAPRKLCGINGGVLYTMDGGRTACNEDGENLGAIPPEDLKHSTKYCVIAHPDCEIPISTTETYCNRTTWFMQEENGGDGILKCSLYTYMPFEAIILGGVEPAFLGIDPERKMLVAPWASWKPENRVVTAWGNFYLPDSYREFMSFIAAELDYPELEDYWIRQEAEALDVYITQAKKNQEEKIKQLERDKENKQNAIERLFLFTYQNRMAPAGKIIPGMDEYLNDRGQVVRKRRLLIGDLSGTTRMPEPKDQEILLSLQKELHDITEELKEAKAT